MTRVIPIQPKLEDGKFYLTTFTRHCALVTVVLLICTYGNLIESTKHFFKGHACSQILQLLFTAAQDKLSPNPNFSNSFFLLFYGSVISKKQNPQRAGHQKKTRNWMHVQGVFSRYQK